VESPDVDMIYELWCASIARLQNSLIPLQNLSYHRHNTVPCSKSPTTACRWYNIQWCIKSDYTYNRLMLGILYCVSLLVWLVAVVVKGRTRQQQKAVAGMLKSVLLCPPSWT